MNQDTRDWLVRILRKRIDECCLPDGTISTLLVAETVENLLRVHLKYEDALRIALELSDEEHPF